MAFNNDYGMLTEALELSFNDKEFVEIITILHDADLKLIQLHQAWKFLDFFSRNAEKKSKRLCHLRRKASYLVYEQIRRVQLLNKLLGYEHLMTHNISVIESNSDE